MASGGGGNRPTNLSFSVPSAFSSASLSSSLQTPDTNTFFLSSLSGTSSSSSSRGRDASAVMLGNASPSSAGSHPFSSLEELLNVTGINSPDLGGPGAGSGGGGGGGGVDSLQQLAKEVENKQLAATELQPPAAKRPHLDLKPPSLAPPTQPHPPSTQLHHLPSNIRVQPLNFSAPSQTTNPSVTIASLLDKKHPSVPSFPSPTTLPPPIGLTSAPPVTSTSVPVVPSLFSSVYQASTLSQQHQMSTSNRQLSEPNSLMSVSTNLTALAPTMIGNQTSASTSSPFTTSVSTNLTAAAAAAPAMISNQARATTSLSSSFSFTTTSSVSSLSQPFLPTSSLSTTASITAPSLPSSQPVQNLSFHSRLPTTSTVGGSLASLSLPAQPPSGQTLSSLSLPSTVALNFNSLGATGTTQLGSLGVGNINATTASTSTAALSSTAAGTSSSGTLSAATSPVGGGLSTNPLIQLVQMYKHFQSQGDSQGMMRVRQQLNILVARQKIINAQNSLRAASALSSAQSSSTVNLPPLSTSSASVTVQNVNVGSQNSTSSKGFAQMPQVQQQSGQNQSVQPQQPQQQSGTLPNFSTASSTLLAKPSAPKPSQMAATVSQVPPSMLSPTLSVAAASSTQPQANTISSGMSITTSTTVSQTPFSAPPAKVPTSISVPQQPSPVGTVASQSLQQQIVKRLQTVIASLPESQRPKTIPELRDFVQKYSSLITQNNLFDLSVPGSAGSQVSKSTAAVTTAALASTSTPRPGPSSLAGGTRLSQSGSIPSLLNSSASVGNSGAKLSHPLPSAVSSAVAAPPLPPTPAAVTAPSSQINTATSQSPSAQVAEHFKSSLAGLATSKAPMGPTVGAAVSSVLASSASSNPLPIGLVVPGRVGGVGMPVPSTVHAPVTTQFSQKVGTVNLALPQVSKPSATIAVATTSQAPPTAPPTSSTTTVTSTSSQSQQGGSTIQPGVATPLPPGLTLETLGVLCRLPETDLLKLKLPAALLSAIKVWKARQPPSKSAARASASANRSSIPVLTASVPSSTASGRTSTVVQSQPQLSTAVGVSPYSMKVGANAASSSRNYFQQTTAAVQANKAASTSIQQQQQPMVIPNSAGFPPRSLHAYIPGLPVSSFSQKSNSSTSNAHRHQTRYKAKVEQQKAENERLQALAKALQSSEEARIAYRFSAHLDKMHTQLLQPDTVTPFRSRHDILARLLPYHVYAEPEPPPAAVEKADAVFESVAQVLLSRSRGLTSRFQQIVSKSDAEGGPEQLAMKMQLERLFIEGEQERIKQENIEKQQAEQIAADLSLMADGVDAFEPDFSLGDAFCPLMDMTDNTGIT